MFYNLNKTFNFDKILIRIIIKFKFQMKKNAFKIIRLFSYNLKSRVFKNRLKISKKLMFLKIKK